MHICIAIADFYQDIASMLLEGANAALRDVKASHDVVRVPGALEIPSALASAAASGRYDGYIGLGCIIRGDTSHYDYVCTESARGLMTLSLRPLAVGNGILTVESRQQAIERADIAGKNKGAAAVHACVALIEWQRACQHNEDAAS
ncbi:MAG: 6,7-dimethyl-8-ribityllumazine synthase [Sphaerospermopsis sp. SIO1G2]|nr:6,7-dimethyl-8-ribityllumazine synthase [Sphaerospermopsis sp. SIO1G2]